MARVRMVTRTVESTVATVMCVDITSASVSNVERTISGKYEDKADVLKAVQAIFDTDTVKNVSVVSFTTNVTLYGMPEQDFIKNAKILPPRKANEDTDEG